MDSFNHLSLATKLRLIITGTAAVVLFFVLTIVVVMEVTVSKKAMVDKVSGLGSLISTHVTASLTFDDPKTASNMLSSLSSEPDLVIAIIHDEQHNVFSEFKSIRNKNVAPLPSHEAFHRPIESNYFEFNRLHSLTPIILEEEVIGTLYIQFDLESLFNQMIKYITVSIFIFLLATLLIYFASDRLHRRISRPIEKLLEGMSSIAYKQDYSLRIEKHDNDEIGKIVTGFNFMISQIENRNTKLKEKAKEIEKHSLFDSLTGLPNRRLLMRQLEKELGRCRRNGMIGALLFLDLDHFKIINDSLGHSTGDNLLRSIADRLSKSLRATDLPSRVGGDEFIVLLPDLSKSREHAADAAFKVAESIRSKVILPHQVEHRLLYTSPSIGITLFDENTVAPEELIKHADLAMYQAKETGRNTVRFFADDMQRLASERMFIEDELRYALNNNPEQIELRYQPQVNSDKEIVGAEVLVRWHHPLRGYISPATFIPVAETTGLINSLGREVIRKACIQLVEWNEKGLLTQLAVNVSPNEFLYSGFTNGLMNIIEETGADPKQLEIEITEGVLLKNIEETIRLMNLLRSKNFNFAIDDFGTGYSSLQYLKSLPISKLKIDQSFVRDITTGKNDAAIVSTIIAMTKTLNLDVIAEGVEKVAEYTFLRSEGCHHFQGYLFGKPLEATEFEALLLKQSRVDESPTLALN